MKNEMKPIMTTPTIGLKGEDKVEAVRANLRAIKFKFKLRLNLEKSGIRVTIGTSYGYGSYGNPDYTFQSWEEADSAIELIRLMYNGTEVKSRHRHFKGKVIGVQFNKSILKHVKFNDEMRRFWIE